MVRESLCNPVISRGQVLDLLYCDTGARRVVPVSYYQSHVRHYRVRNELNCQDDPLPVAFAAAVTRSRVISREIYPVIGADEDYQHATNNISGGKD